MDGDGNDGQVEVVEHDGNVMMQASLRVEVEIEGAAADQRDRDDVGQPGKLSHKLSNCVTVTVASELLMFFHCAQNRNDTYCCSLSVKCRSSFSWKSTSLRASPSCKEKNTQSEQTSAETRATIPWEIVTF